MGITSLSNKTSMGHGGHGTPTDSLQDQGTKQPGIQKSQSFIYMGSLNWIISGLF